MVAGYFVALKLFVSYLAGLGVLWIVYAEKKFSSNPIPTFFFIYLGEGWGVVVQLMTLTK